MTDREAVRGSLIGRLSEVLSTAALLRADAARWNAAHPHEEPIDADPDGELARQEAWARRELESLRRKEDR